LKLDECFRRGLLKRITADEENALRSLELSKSNIDDAEASMSIRRYRVVVVSSYTAMFHAARAILFRDGVKERSHECIPVYIKESYPGLVRVANTLDSYRRFRHNVIYGLDVLLDEDEARAALDAAKETLLEVKKFMNVN
jgi:uncharacterized protein (UPF0332 family)